LLVAGSSGREGKGGSRTIFWGMGGKKGGGQRREEPRRRCSVVKLKTNGSYFQHAKKKNGSEVAVDPEESGESDGREKNCILKGGKNHWWKIFPTKVTEGGIKARGSRGAQGKGKKASACQRREGVEGGVLPLNWKGRKKKKKKTRLETPLLEMGEGCTGRKKEISNSRQGGDCP